MNQYVVIGTSPFHDTTVVVGPLRLIETVAAADAVMVERGWNTEICELFNLADIPNLTNDEGADV